MATVTCPHCQAPLTPEARFCPGCGKASSPTESGHNWQMQQGAPDLVGREIAGRYRISKKLGEGGMGAVYRGEQMALKRTVAIKLLRPELSANPQILQRFDVEAKAVAKLSHPNTVIIFDSGQDTDGTLFIAMEYIEGRSLREAIQKEGPFSLQRSLAIALQVAASLSDAHAHSIVHRDLKPDNVMLQTRGRQKDVVRVLDFGIAKLRDDNRATQAAMTQAGDMLGTPQYMAPEQIKGEAIDGRTDVYALGCMIYEMVTGRLPYEAPTVMAMLSKHLVEDVIPPSQRRPELGLPPAIDQLVLAAMAKEPRQRPGTMDEYSDMIGGLLAQLPPGDPNRSAGLSLQQGAVPGPAITPAAHSAFQSPVPGGHFTPQSAYPAMTPAPSFAQPTGRPPIGPAPMGPPPGVPYAPPPGSAPQPYQPPIPPTVPMQGYAPPAPAPKSSRAPLYAVLGVLVLGGAGVGVWAATRKTDSASSTSGKASGSAALAQRDDDKRDEGGPTQVPLPDPDVAAGGRDPWDPDDTPSIGKPQPKQPQPKPQPKQPVVDPDDVDDPDEADPTDHTPTPPTPPTPPASVGTALTPIPAGASLTPPPGFTLIQKTSEAIAYMHQTTGETVLMAPLVAGTNDPKQLAAIYAQQTGAQLKGDDKIVSAGAQRPAFAFVSTNAGTQIAHVAVIYISSTYRVGVLYLAPEAVVGQVGFEQKLEKFFRSGVRLPASPQSPQTP